MNLSIKDLTDFLLCPYLIENRMKRLPRKINEEMAIGVLVHAARVELNTVKRRLAVEGKPIGNCPKHFVELALQRVGCLVPLEMRLERILARSTHILTEEWRWEQKLLPKHPLNAVYPIKMEEPVKFPPGVYGRADGILLLDEGPIPIEYKTWQTSINTIYSFQVWAYCMGISFKYRVPVHKGFLQYGYPPTRVEVKFGAGERAQVLKVYNDCANFLNTGKTSSKPTKGTCKRCRYQDCEQRRWLCG